MAILQIIGGIIGTLMIPIFWILSLPERMGMCYGKEISG